MGLEALTRAAEQGHAQAQFLCGCMYRQGVGVEVDERQALTWLRRSGKQGVLEAQLACAEIYETGNGAKLNLKQALYWYEQAAKQGSLAAQLKCGNMYCPGCGADQQQQGGLWAHYHPPLPPGPASRSHCRPAGQRGSPGPAGAVFLGSPSLPIANLKNHAVL